MTNAEAINARKQAAKDLLECTKPHTKAAKKHDKKNGWSHEISPYNLYERNLINHKSTGKDKAMTSVKA